MIVVPFDNLPATQDTGKVGLQLRSNPDVEQPVAAARRPPSSKVTTRLVLMRRHGVPA